jgi:glutamate racemase
LKIGIFDSGIGGLTVLHQAMLLLPNEEYIFYADSDHVPYGEKPKEEIVSYVDGAVQFMLQKGTGAVVIACNTATSVAIEYLRKKYSIPILGIEPAVKPAVKECGGKRIMVVATPVTVREEKLKNLIAQVDETHLVDLLPLPKLVRFAERGIFQSPEITSYLHSMLAGYDLQAYSTLVLGCTHFNFFKDTFRKIFPAGINIIDGSAGTVNHLADILKEKMLPESPKPSVEYYRSGRKVTNSKTLRHIGELHKRLDLMLHL